NTVRAETDPNSIPGGDAAARVAGVPGSIASSPGGRTALVPGFLAGVAAAHERFGARPFAEVVAPAIACAERGFALTPEIAALMKARAEVLSRLPATRAIFTRADGKPYAAGDLFKQPALARTLRAIVKQGVDAHVYRGEWARAFVKAVRAEGGKMTLADLRAYRPSWIEPVHGSFNGFDVYAHGLPASGGAALILSLNLATAAKLDDLPPYADSPLALFRLLRFAKASTVLSAPGVAAQLQSVLGLDLSSAALLRQDTAERLLQLIDAGRVPSVGAALGPASPHSDGVVAVDARGNVASVVHTINTVNWGSTGIFVGGISIPDAASFQQARIASVTPGARLPDDTSPGVVLRDGKPALGFSAIGVGVAVRTFGALLDVLGHGKTPGQAVASPSLGGFDWSRAATGEVTAVVGTHELSPEYLRELSALGQATVEDDARRGYWIGVSVAPSSPRLRAGELREIRMGGGAVGY
ncbi:MAG: gamma-glutamyltransferase, partial [Polyangiaceae bacterium]